jgi:N-methylhydantoinase B
MAHGDTRLIPLELQETILPFRVESFSLRQDSAGPGKFRGGLGFSKHYLIMAPCFLQTNLDRTKFPPWGVLGGKDGKPGRVVVTKKSGETKTVCKAKGYKLETGDRVALETGGGGGYGSPAERALALIQRDLDRGYVSHAAAEKDYGVAIDKNGRASRA